MSDVEYQLRRSAEAAKGLLANLRNEGAADDAELVADTIEGGTDLREVIAVALSELDECDLIEVGAKAKRDEYASRASAAKARAERIRAMIERALIEIELAEPMRLPQATLSLTRRARQVVVADEAAIPARFFVEQPRPAPNLDKKALAAALAENGATPIPGASLDNGSISLSVRRK